MPAIPVISPWPLLLLLAVLPVQAAAAAASAPQLWHCAPCSAEKLALCPPVPASCPERSRPAGCGCCPVCALPLGAACGVATARCARGLSCRALPGEPRPLHALTRGQGACMREETAATQRAAPSTKAPEPPTAPQSGEMTEEQLLERFHLMASSSEDVPALWNAISTLKGTGAQEGAPGTKRKGPCQRELYRVLEQLAKAQQEAGGDVYRFYLPNCNKNGFYHSKQCETSLDGEAGLCWCVYPWSGKRIPGSLEIRGDPKCHQHFNAQN
nr:insulin-like growth factor-binding protein 1 [Oryctolagus cuniculus]